MVMIILYARQKETQMYRTEFWTLWEKVRVDVDRGETDRGEVREEIVVGNACAGKPGSHGSKAMPLSHA